VLLKSLELQGFKTFPDKTTLSFDKGITAVVGPNGSGKSNISDAIRWVLGEQSSRNLRCSSMEDVVFSGTPARKAQGFAEVTLTVDNRDRRLPFDGDEVSVTRRYYRSGESEYQINRAGVRLRDIHELFMDTGLGRDGYSIIGQGKIDSIVASRSEDRREIFEEAAGISRYRYRKTESERRLKQTEENLVRLRDILTELEGRVGPLAEQAAKAKTYLAYAEEKKKLEIGLWLDTLEKSGRLLREQEDRIEIACSQHGEIEEVLQQIAREIEQVFQEGNEQAARIDEIRRQIASFEEAAASKTGEASVLENDILHNTENAARLEREVAQAHASAHSLEEEIAGKKAEVSARESVLDSLRLQLEECEGGLAALQLELQQSSEKGGALAEQLAAYSRRLSEQKVAYLTAESSGREISARGQAVKQALVDRQMEAETLRAALADFYAMERESAERAESLSNAVKGYELRLQTRRQKLDTAKKEADRLSLDAEERIRRARLLEELERNLEGFAHSVKTVMKEARRGTLRGIHGPVSRLLHVPEPYAVAIETALGAAMQNIVVGTEEEAKRAIAALKQKDGGRATFLPLTTIRGNVLQEPDLAQCAGFVGIAADLCSCEAQYEGIRKNLLGRIAVAEDLDSAVAIARRYHFRFRIVTLDGQVVNAGGSLTGGSLAKNAGLLGRTAEIERIHREAQALKDQAASARAAFNVQEAEYAAAEAALSGARGELASAQEESIRIGAERKNCQSGLSTAENALKALLMEQQEIIRRMQELETEQTAAQGEISACEKAIEEREVQMQAVTGGQESVARRREELTAEMQELRLQIVTEEKDIQSLNTEISGIRGRMNDHSGRVSQLLEEKKALTARNALLRVQIDTLRAESDTLRQKAKEAQRQIDQCNQARMELEARSVKLRQDERALGEQREKLSGELARLEERKDTLQRDYDKIIASLWEEYELTRREAEELGGKLEDVPAAQKRLNELKLKIRGLGAVNVGAIEEYQEVEQRYRFLREQVQDVERSREELVRLIGELTRQMRDLFLERFHQINEQFDGTFRELFGGGKASLSLTDPSDILSSGIEISVQPPGKIVTHLELLSGGEKALVAIALYFAIMKVSPAPFCVLDEIEAALDDVNVDRFAAYLRRMNQNTQFIVITHRRGTMEEADVLYGVTMQDEGVSKLLELHASEVGQKLGL
jgi:chromosome segregation protein